MNERTIVEAIHTGHRNNIEGEYYRDLILMYDDGTWEKIFRHDLRDGSNVKRVNTAHLVGKTRDRMIAELEELYYSDIIKGRFLDQR
jgi:hypothetical protein